MNQELSDNRRNRPERATRIAANQDRLGDGLSAQFDFIVCGAGASGSVIAGRLAANPDVRVLLLEAGGTDELELVMDPNQWAMALGGELHWDFVAAPNGPPVSARAAWIQSCDLC